MKVTITPIQGVAVVATDEHVDARGGFARWFCENELRALLDGERIVQINRSLTRDLGTIRGMHFQYPPHAEIKFVRCMKGRIWDVAVDLRSGSATFRRWHAEELSEDNGRMLVVPKGCAHGFQALTDSAEVLYLHTAQYAPDAEGGVAFDDPVLAIRWPVAVSMTGVSKRDRALQRLDDGFAGIAL